MPITKDVRKLSDTLVAQSKTTLSESSKPLYALVGANDLAVEKLRDGFTTLQTRGSKLPEKLRERVVTLPQEYKALPTTVLTYAGTVSEKAGTVFGELSERGEKVVGQIRRRPATRRAVTHAAQTKSNAKATKTSATKAVKATSAAAS